MGKFPQGCKVLILFITSSYYDSRLICFVETCFVFYVLELIRSLCQYHVAYLCTIILIPVCSTEFCNLYHSWRGF